MGKDWDRFSATAPILRVGWDQAGGVHQVAPVRNDSPASGARVAFHKRRSTYRCSECGRRDGFRNPHDCPGEWLTEFVDAEPLEARAFGAWCELWAREVLRVLKPGAHLLAFGGTRTVHRLAVALEEAGFEIRDSLAWGYAQGFPKSHNLSGEWSGWGTALKPAWEPILMARKLPAGTVAESVARYGTGALHIDAARIPISPEDAAVISNGGGFLRDGYVAPEGVALSGRLDGSLEDRGEADSSAGRWPANVVLTDETLGPDSRFFMVPKASGDEREPVMRQATNGDRENTHPTVKPLDLMRHLVRLVTPPAGVVLDPFLGSGTTALAAELEGFGWVGIERDPEYVAIAEARLRGWQRGLGLDVAAPAPTRTAKPRAAAPPAPEVTPEAGLFD